MDLRLYSSVLWRFRVVVAIGLLLAVALTVLSVARVSFSHGFKVSYRQPEQWSSTAMLWVTQNGFPVGRSVYDKFLTGPSGAVIPAYSNPGQFSGTATIFAALVSSDQVLSLLAKQGPIDGSIQASQPTLPGNSSLTLPFFQLTGTSTSAAAAENLTARATRAMIQYVQDQQRANGIAPNKRVVLQVVKEPSVATLTKKHKLTTPIVVFIATLLATMGLVFLLENMRPRIREVAGGAEEEPAPVAAARHTA
jgi:hypothetical protein